MNKEIAKIIKKKNREPSSIKQWWGKNKITVLRIILFPLWIGMKTQDKITTYLNSKCKWDEKRANEVLSYYIPRYAEWDEEAKILYFFDNGFGWNNKIVKKYIKFKDRRWWKEHCEFNGGRIRDYLIKDFELEGFSKEVGETTGSRTEIIFELNEK